jgi:putative FmdB family regulatory protein
VPIYEYRCLDCGEDFEDLIRNKRDEEELECPSCRSRNFVKQMSAFGVRGAVEKPITAGSGGCSGCSSSSCSTCHR